MATMTESKMQYLDVAIEWASANPKDAELALATFIVVLANFLAQIIVKVKKGGESWVSWDLFAILRMASWTVISTPIVGLWLQTLANTFGSAADVPTVASKLVVDQFLFGPALLSCFLLYSGLFDSVTRFSNQVSPAIEKIRCDLFKMQRAGWAVWIPVAILNFSVIPDQFKIIFLNVIGLFWNIGFALMMMDDGEAKSRTAKAESKLKQT
mmetsp:Transcript_62933/g.148175  ORF Transcript_62933/g.148175 Transcript_62933/m.148175 type:complete len:211 (+) Transcript_62933:37-669(+)